MTPASCAPEETAARFQNSSPPAAPRGGDRPPLSRAPPVPSSGPLPQPSRLARRVSCSTPRSGFNQTHWDGTEQAPGTRNTARRQRANKQSRALQRPHPHALCSRGPLGLAGPPPGRGRPRRPASSPLAPVWAAPEQTCPAAPPRAPGIWEAGAQEGGKGRLPRKRQAPQVAPVGTRTNSRLRGREGRKKEKRGDWSEEAPLRASWLRRPQHLRPRRGDRGAPSWGTGDTQTVIGVPSWRS